MIQPARADVEKDERISALKAQLEIERARNAKLELERDRYRLRLEELVGEPCDEGDEKAEFVLAHQLEQISVLRNDVGEKAAVIDELSSRLGTAEVQLQKDEAMFAQKNRRIDELEAKLKTCESGLSNSDEAEPDDFSMQQSMMDEDLRQLADNIGAKQQFLQTLDQSEAEYEQLRQYYAQQVEAKNLVIQQTKQEMSKLLEAIESVEANRHEEKSRLSKDYGHKVLFLERQVPPTPKALFGPRRYRARCVMAGAVALRKGARTRQTAATER